MNAKWLCAALCTPILLSQAALADEGPSRADLEQAILAVPLQMGQGLPMSVEVKEFSCNATQCGNNCLVTGQRVNKFGSGTKSFPFTNHAIKLEKFGTLWKIVQEY